LGPRTSVVSIRAAPPPGKLTTLIAPAVLKLPAVLLIAAPMLVAMGPIGVFAAAPSGSVTPAIIDGARLVLSAAKLPTMAKVPARESRP